MIAEENFQKPTLLQKNTVPGLNDLESAVKEKLKSSRNNRKPNQMEEPAIGRMEA